MKITFSDLQASLDLTFNILYCPSSNSSCMDESKKDPSLVTYRDPITHKLMRRVKHFSGYNVAAGDDDSRDSYWSSLSASTPFRVVAQVMPQPIDLRALVALPAMVRPKDEPAAHDVHSHAEALRLHPGVRLIAARRPQGSRAQSSFMLGCARSVSEATCAGRSRGRCCSSYQAVTVRSIFSTRGLILGQRTADTPDDAGVYPSPNMRRPRLPEKSTADGGFDGARFSNGRSARQ